MRLVCTHHVDAVEADFKGDASAKAIVDAWGNNDIIGRVQHLTKLGGCVDAGRRQSGMAIGSVCVRHDNVSVCCL